MGLKATSRFDETFAGTMSWSESGLDLVICAIAHVFKCQMLTSLTPANLQQAVVCFALHRQSQPGR